LNREQIVMTEDQKTIVLGVDLDGVCADFYARMREIAAEWFEKPLKDLTPDVTYGLPEWGIGPIEQYHSLHRFAVTERNLFGTVSIIPGARKVLRKLSNEGYHIRIITHRLFIQYFHALAVQQTIEWLDHNGIPYHDLCFMKEKEQVGANIYIEDSPANINNLRGQGFYTICYSNSTNKQIEDPRADTWDDVYKLIKAWKA
jgi:5'(3')-deoxyribonucleotidase